MTTRVKPWTGAGAAGVRRRRGATRLALAAATLLAVGCRSEMYDQPRYEPYETSSFFADGLAMRPVVAGTVAHRPPKEADAYDADYLERGLIDGKPATEFPFAINSEGMARGRQRFNIYCAPCHGQVGDGNGMIVQRGFPKPPSLYGPRMVKPVDGGPVSIYNDLREAPAGHFVNVIAEGHGVMYSYASRVAPEDRWRIAAYIRALQASQFATIDVLKTLPEPSEEEQGMIEEVSR